MNFRLVFRVTGKTLMVLSMTMLLPLLVCLIYRENPVPFLLAIAITGGVGLLLSLIRSDDHFFPREGFFAVALIWLLVGACGALPFYFCGQFASYIDCFFEAVSGFTTTGSSILTEVESLPHGILFWRSFTHWLGGMGVLVLTIALMPSLGGRTVGDQLSCRLALNSQMSHRWEKPSKPRSASGLRYSGAKTMVARSSRTSPAWRGTPNLLVKSV